MNKKILVITGGSSGIGEATALLYQKLGWKVINLSRTPLKAKGVVNLTVDLAKLKSEKDLEKEMELLIPKKVRISLVHNAAITWFDSALEIDIGKLKKMFNVNVFSPIILNKLLIKKMGKGSSIIYIGSTLSEASVPNSASYIITKHALAGLMKSTCQDLISYPGIHTCCICPGPTDTKMLHHLFSDDVIEKNLLNDSKMRLTDPEEIALLIYFAALSPAINGSLIHTNHCVKGT